MAVLLDANSEYLYNSASPPGTGDGTIVFWYYCTLAYSGTTRKLWTFTNAGSGGRQIYGGWNWLNAGPYSGTAALDIGDKENVWIAVYVIFDVTADVYMGYRTAGGAWTDASIGSWPGGDVGSGATWRLSGDFEGTTAATGRIAGVKYWDRALSLEEAKAETYSLRPLQTTNLWGVFPLVDLSGNNLAGGANLSTGGSPTLADGPPVGWGAAPQLYGPAAAGRVIGPGQIWPTVTM